MNQSTRYISVQSQQRRGSISNTMGTKIICSPFIYSRISEIIIILIGKEIYKRLKNKNLPSNCSSWFTEILWYKLTQTDRYHVTFNITELNYECPVVLIMFWVHLSIVCVCLKRYTHNQVWKVIERTCSS